MEKTSETSPLGRYLGVEFLEVGNGEARVRLLYRPELTNPAGKLHGGAIASVADIAMAVAVGSLLGGDVGRHSTARLQVRYKWGVTSGEVIAEARAQRRKGRLFIGEAVLKDGGGTTVALARATFLVDAPDQ